VTLPSREHLDPLRHFLQKAGQTISHYGSPTCTVLITHIHVPRQTTSQAIQTQKMSISGCTENAIIEDCQTPIGATDISSSYSTAPRGTSSTGGGFSHAVIAPDLPTSPCVKRTHLRRSRDVHDPVTYKRHHLQPSTARIAFRMSNERRNIQRGGTIAVEKPMTMVEDELSLDSCSGHRHEDVYLIGQVGGIAAGVSLL
jgi:hypothetical protein